MGNRDKLSLPKNWPADVRYLATPFYSPKLTASQLAALRTRNTTDDALPDAASKPGPNTAVHIVRIADAAHPANGQSGLFAARDLRPGEAIVTYRGEVHPGGASSLTSDYDLWLDRAADVAVDAAAAGNEARFVNDYRGVPGAVRPNAEFREVWDGRRGERTMAVYVLPTGKKAVGRARTVGVAKGEEILVSYGKGFWEKRAGEEAEDESCCAGEDDQAQ